MIILGYTNMPTSWWEKKTFRNESVSNSRIFRERCSGQNH